MVKRRRTLRAEAGHGLRRLSAGPVRVGRTDGDYVGIISWSADCRIAACPGVVVLSHVAGGHNHDDASPPRGFHRLAQRIERVALIYSPRQQKIHYSDVVGVLESDSLLNRCDHLAVRAGSSAIQ